MITTHTICTVPNGEACLLATETEGLLVDSGYDCGSADMARRIGEILDGRRLTAVLLTHSHYDHVSGCPGIRELYPDAQVVASALTAQLLGKEKVRQTIRHLNQEISRTYGQPFEDRSDDLAVDMALSDQDVVQLGGFTITALETPGHTRCCMSYYIHQEEILVCSESTGEWVDGKLLPGFIVSYAMAMESIEKCAATKPKRISVPHYGELEESTAGDFFARAREAAQGAASFLDDCQAAGLDQDAIIQAFVKAYYGENHDMPQEAVLLNTTAMVAKYLEQKAQ